MNLVEKEESVAEKLGSAIVRASKILGHAESIHVSVLGEPEPSDSRAYGEFMLDGLSRLCWILESATVLLQRVDGQLIDPSRPDRPVDPS